MTLPDSNLTSHVTRWYDARYLFDIDIRKLNEQRHDQRQARGVARVQRRLGRGIAAAEGVCRLPDKARRFENARHLDPR